MKKAVQYGVKIKNHTLQKQIQMVIYPVFDTQNMEKRPCKQVYITVCKSVFVTEKYCEI